MAAVFSEPSPRWGHCSAAVGGKHLYLWGGRTENYRRDRNTLTSTVHVFDIFTESWETKHTSGSPPPGVYGGASASTGHCLYQYGGFDGSSSCDSFSSLDVTTFQWTELPRGDAMKKSRCTILPWQARGCLVVFGGVGVRIGPIQEGADFKRLSTSKSGHGFTNEMHVFNLKEGLLPIVICVTCVNIKFISVRHMVLSYSFWVETSSM